MEIEKNDNIDIDLDSEDLQKLLKKVTSFQLLTISEIKFICDKSISIIFDKFKNMLLQSDKSSNQINFIFFSSLVKIIECCFSPTLFSSM